MILQLYKQILLRRCELFAAALQPFQPGVLFLRETGTAREEHFELHAVVNKARLWQASLPRRSQNFLDAASLTLDDTFSIFRSEVTRNLVQPLVYRRFGQNGAL